MRIGSLFSGIGGLELGLERAGVGHVVWQCEIDAFCRAVLAKHWPNVTRFEDVTRPRNSPVDIICGGFPCQDVSGAGAGRGLGGERSSLWWHFADVVRTVRPRFVVVENVTSGKVRWLPHVRHTLHLLGYDTEALGVAARDLGAPHRRERVFVVAHARGLLLRNQPRGGAGRSGPVRMSLESMARKGLWPTLVRRDDKGMLGKNSKRRESSLPNVAGGPLNPTWAEWFMGFPVGWTDGVDAPASARSATRSSPRARKSRAA